MASPGAATPTARRVVGSPTRARFDPVFAGWITLFALALYIVALPVQLAGQSIMAWSVLLALAVIRRFAKSGVLRAFFLFLAAYLTVRYLWWRTLYTLSYHDPLSLVAALSLYGAEVYGITIYLLGIFVNIQPLRRDPLPLAEDPERLPSVDILIPSYNEDPKLLEVTLLAAAYVRYPKEKLKIYLLDDGGTLQKRQDPDPLKAAAALGRHQELQQLCREIGAHYLTRERNEHAKAGNINAALKRTGGELVLILDADHVPTADILEETVGWFVRDPLLFLVQTPHFFINPDPIEKNLGVFQTMPSENEMFYSVIQRGLDFWNAAFFCGSAAVLRRRCLEEIGGISGQTITEDAETALELHSRGYRSAFLRRPVTSGLQPETFTAFVLQRVRWAQGMVQIILLKNPLLKRGLRLPQRLCYMSSSFFWFFGYARVAFLLAPSAYLLLGLMIYDANLPQFLAYALPHVMGAILVSDFLFGRVRWVFVSELYEIMQSVFSMRAVTQVLAHPRSPRFRVTPKGEQLQTDFISPLARPFYVLTLIILLSLAAGPWRLARFPLERDAVVITTGWAIFNLMLILGALGALLERRQRRADPRVPAGFDARLLFDSSEAPCHVQDISVGGAGVLVDAKAPFLEAGRAGRLRVENRALRKTSDLRVSVRSRKKHAPHEVVLGIHFDPASRAERAEIVALVHGDSERWRRYLSRIHHSPGVTGAVTFLFKTGAKYAMAHLGSLFSESLTFFYGLARGILRAAAARAASWRSAAPVEVL